MPVGLLTLHCLLPGCTSLKEKRGRIKPILARLHREFNLSTAETGHQDAWQEAELSFAVVSSDAVNIERVLQQAASYVEAGWPDDCVVLDQKLEII